VVPGSSHYAITQQTAAVKVDKLPVTITAGNIAYTYSTTPGTIGCVVSTPNPDAITCTASIVGGVTVPFASDANYSITAVDGTVTVNPLPVTVTAGNIAYAAGTTPPTPSCTIVPNPDNVQCTVAVVGNSTVPSVTDSHYAITYVDGTATVQEPINCTTLPGSVVYGNAPLTLTCSSLSSEAISFKVTGSGAKGAAGTTPGTYVLTITGVGTFSVTASQAGQKSGKVVIVAPYTTAAQSVTVTPLARTITAGNITWMFGAKTQPVYGYTLSDASGNPATMAYADKLTVTYNVADPTQASGQATNGKSALGTYTIIPGTKANANYSFSFDNGTLTYEAVDAIKQVPAAPGPVTFKDTLAGAAVTSKSSTAKIVVTNNTGAESVTFAPAISSTNADGSVDFTVANTTTGQTTSACTVGRAGACTFTVTFAPTAANLGALAETLTLNITDNDNTASFTDPNSSVIPSSLSWTLKGNSVGPFTVSTPAFVATKNGSTNVQTVTVTNNTDYPMNTIKVVSSNSKHFVVSTDGTNTCVGTAVTVAAGSSCSFNVTFAPVAGGTATGDSYAGTLTVTAKAAGAQTDVLTPVVVDLTAANTDWVNYSPAGSASTDAATPLALSAAKAGKTGTAVVTLTNNSNAVLASVQYAVGGDASFSAASTCNGTQAATKTCTVTVTFKAPATAAAGSTYLGTLNITDSVTGAPYYYALTGTVQ
jgi:hypothetical protein